MLKQLAQQNGEITIWCQLDGLILQGWDNVLHNVLYALYQWWTYAAISSIAKTQGFGSQGMNLRASLLALTANETLVKLLHLSPITLKYWYRGLSFQGRNVFARVYRIDFIKMEGETSPWPLCAPYTNEPAGNGWDYCISWHGSTDYQGGVGLWL